MDPVTAISLATAGMSLIEQLIPIINDMRLSGQITAEQQRQVLDRYQSLKARADGQFSGPEWAIVPQSQIPNPQS